MSVKNNQGFFLVYSFGLSLNVRRDKLEVVTLTFAIDALAAFYNR